MPFRAKPARSEADTALWHRAMRDVKQLAPRAEPVPAPSPARAKPAENQLAAAPPPAPNPSLPPLVLGRFAGIDRANAERLKRGKHKVEALLDLHGMTQDQAHRALAAFIPRARADGKRCVLVITGRGNAKGPHAGGGVLKSAVPRWLDEPEFRPHLLAIATAQPRDGGNGALYVMLRRTRAG
jgi:DNA-nicking Smr family endonuclease